MRGRGAEVGYLSHASIWGKQRIPKFRAEVEDMHGIKVLQFSMVL